MKQHQCGRHQPDRFDHLREPPDAVDLPPTARAEAVLLLARLLDEIVRAEGKATKAAGGCDEQDHR